VCSDSAPLPLWKTFQLHRDHRSGNREKLITIISESVITIIPNTDHDHPGIVITSLRITDHHALEYALASYQLTISTRSAG
jgi:hypothetical protein